ncbi:MAG: heavy metal translocating P-type ATPase [Verrucomicrobiales bacterium]|jgi:Cd2+/Zn2+-exporting ATPase|nr:heavy metal translocating P-type ATPase [Verrucomicrobiales bacterium]
MMTADHDCLLDQVSQALLDDRGLRAIWLDSAGKKVAFAYQAGLDHQAADRRLREICRRHAPLEPRAGDGGQPRCLTCENHHSAALPAGLRLVAMPDGGLMLEKLSCVTAPRFWRWHQFPWLEEVKPGWLTDAHREDLHEWRQDMVFAGACGALVLAGFLIEQTGGAGSLAAIACYVAGYLAGAWRPAGEACALLRRRVVDIHFLMLCVAGGAAAIGHWWEGGALLFLFASSGALEELAMARTRREIDSLFKDAPQEATVIVSGAEQRLPVAQLAAGMTLRVRPGELFAADAVIVSGGTAANEASLTGESTPVDKAAGDEVFSGTLNLWGAVDCRVIRAAADSALAKVLKLIREAQDSKAPAQRFTDRFSSGYTWLVLGGCAAMFFVWWLAAGRAPFFAADGERSAFYLAMTLLVVASPCALVLSIPSAILAGIAAGARHGVLFRGGAAIEKLAAVCRVALDKTGTLTTGELAVVGVECVPADQAAEFKQVAAALGNHSAHPVSRAIAASFSDQALTVTVADFRAEAGLGVTGSVGGRAVRLGRRAFFAGPDGDWAQTFPEPEPGMTETLLDTGAIKGRFLLRDAVRDASAPLLADLRATGLRVTMLTGDRPEAAAKVAQQLGLDDYRAGLKPEDKVAAIRAWEQAGERVAMIGDGVNDAPSLAAATVSVGMGLRGSDAVLEQADIVLTRDRLENFKYAHDLSVSAARIIKQNLAVSLGVMAVLALGALGARLPLTLGVIGHEGSTVVVVLNSLRLLFFAPRKNQRLATKT